MNVLWPIMGSAKLVTYNHYTRATKLSAFKHDTTQVIYKVLQLIGPSHNKNAGIAWINVPQFQSMKGCRHGLRNGELQQNLLIPLLETVELSLLVVSSLYTTLNQRRMDADASTSI